MTNETAAVKESSNGDLASPATVAGAKDLYEIGEIPPLGHVPKNMYAWPSARIAKGRRKLQCRWRFCPRGNSIATTYSFW